MFINIINSVMSTWPISFGIMEVPKLVKELYQNNMKSKRNMVPSKNQVAL